MSVLRLSHHEELRIRSAVVRTPQPIFGPATPVASWMRGPGVLVNDRTLDGCGLFWCGWNGDVMKGWAFYCQCGFATSMRRSFSEGMDQLEDHWLARRSS
jgi:hypothetical protein